jgi:gas vesicle protein
MMMSDQKNGHGMLGVVAAFAVGAMLGAGVALLLAPRSGKETREMLGKKARDLKDAAADAIDQGKHLAGEVKHRAREVIDKGKEAAREIADAATGS